MICYFDSDALVPSETNCNLHVYSLRPLVFSRNLVNISSILAYKWKVLHPNFEEKKKKNDWQRKCLEHVTLINEYEGQKNRNASWQNEHAGQKNHKAAQKNNDAAQENDKVTQKNNDAAQENDKATQKSKDSAQKNV